MFDFSYLIIHPTKALQIDPRLIACKPRNQCQWASSQPHLRRYQSNCRRTGCLASFTCVEWQILTAGCGGETCNRQGQTSVGSAIQRIPRLTDSWLSAKYVGFAWVPRLEGSCKWLEVKEIEDATNSSRGWFGRLCGLCDDMWSLFLDVRQDLSRAPAKDNHHVYHILSDNIHMLDWTFCFGSQRQGFQKDRPQVQTPLLQLKQLHGGKMLLSVSIWLCVFIMDWMIYVCALLPPSARPNPCSKVWAMLSSKHGWRLFAVVQSIAGSSNSNLCRSNYGDGPLISFDGLL